MTQKVPPIHARMARDHLRLSRECLERAYDLDPRLAMDTAMIPNSDAIINKALRKVGLNMSRFSNATGRRHALDGEADHKGALKQLEHATNHISAVESGSSEFDAERFGRYLKGALDCMSGGGEDELTEGERDRAAEEGRDDVGEVAARSAVETTGSGNPRRPDGTGGKCFGGGRVGGSSFAPASTNPDHRKDFNSVAQGGADSAVGYDHDAIMQRDPDDPRYGATERAVRRDDRNSKLRQRNAKKSPQHAQDAQASAPDDYERLDLNEFFQR